MTPPPDVWALAAAKMPLAFAQVREDPRLDVELAAALPPGATVVMIASGGETAACLGRLPLQLHLVDMNPAQIALARLKWQLAGEGNLSAAAALLGHAPLAPEERWRLLGERLDGLGLATDVFGPEEVVAAVGPDQAGRYELTFAALRERLASLTSLLDDSLRSAVPVDLEGSPLGDAMDAAFGEVMTLENLICLFGEGATQNPRLPFSTHFAERTHLAFRRMPPATNPFLWQILAGRFPEDAPYDWLGISSAAHRHPDATAEWHHGKMDAVLDSLPDESAEMIHLSNILDWLSPAEGQTLLSKAARVLKPGGRVIIRQLNSTLDIPALESALAWDPETGRAMEERDRSYFYPQLHLGRKA